jgi:VWFA-related protein
MRRVSGSSLLVGSLLSLFLLGAAPADRSFTENTQVTVVEIPVQVVRDGEPVRGLTAADFEITEGRKHHAITGFDVVDLATPESRRLSADIPAAGKRHFLLLFDLANSNPKSLRQSRAAIMNSLLKTLTPSDLVAVAAYSPVNGMQMLLGFTSDLRLIARAVQQVGAQRIDTGTPGGGYGVAAADIAKALSAINSAEQNLADNANEPLSPGATTVQRLLAATRESVAEAFLRAEAVEVTQEGMEVAQGQHDQMAQARNSVAPLTSAFNDLAHMMGAVAGRKLVVLFSEGFDSTILTGSESAEDQTSMAQATMLGASVAVDSEERFGSTRQTNELEKMLEQFRRTDCVIESIDISGLRGMDLDANARTSGEGSLLVMAHDTGGEIFRNMNDLGQAMSQLLERTSVTYVLSFQPDGLRQDGSYHPIKVQLKNASHGAKLTFRNGYFAPRPYGQQRPVERMLAAADQLMGANQAGSVTTAILAAPFRGSAGRSYVPVFIEADGRTLLDGMTGKVMPAEIYAYAVDGNGFISDAFNQTIQIDLAKAGTLLHDGGLKFYGHLELPPGEYALRVLLRNGATGAFGKRTLLIKVPAFSATDEVLLPPLFPEPGGLWTVVRETPRGKLREAAYPFVVGQQAFVPASRPALRPGEEVPVALVGYNLGGDFKTEAKVVSADGRDLGSCPIRLGGLVPGTGDRPDVYKAFVRPPQALAPGSYQLVITGSGTAGSQTSASDFVVAGAAAGAGR